MSLFKIPLILSAAVATHVSFTPPNVSSSNEVVHNTFNERIMNLLIKYGLPYAKGLYWSISLLETAIIASHAAGPSILPSITQHAIGLHVGRIQDTPITSSFIFGTGTCCWWGLIRWWCFRTLGRLFTFEISVRKEHQLVTTGPYAVVRHPSYTGIVLQFVGVLIVYGSRRTSWLRDSGVLDTVLYLNWLCCYGWWKKHRYCGLLLRVSQEEEVVKSHFGDEWKRWAKVVRYRLIPGIY